jgi:hypothetical protein
MLDGADGAQPTEEAAERSGTKREGQAPPLQVEFEADFQSAMGFVVWEVRDDAGRDAYLI